MKATKHTPGPWASNKDGTTVSHEALGYSLASIHGRYSKGEFAHDEVRANARLISAAPDLLEALELIIDRNPGAVFHNGTDGEVYAEFKQAVRAIKKARGES